MFLPQMLGARDLPFPRLSAFGFWAFLIGGVFLSGSIFFGVAPAGGWFIYPPLTSQYQSGLGRDLWLLGFSFIEVAAIAAAVEMVVGSLRCRPPGMRVNLIPLYVWYVLVAAAMILFAFPPLIAGSLLMEIERAFQWPFFDPTRGGDPLLWQHLFWLFGHPEVYIIFLPSIALIAMIVPTFVRRPIVGYSWVVLAAIGTGFVSFGLWVHHMFTTGLPGISLGLFSAASITVAIRVSRAVGERVLLPAVRGATPDTIVVADEFSCREQIAQETRRRAIHLAESCTWRCSTTHAGRLVMCQNGPMRSTTRVSDYRGEL